jgi:membrane protein DedA with SNARE-associated domain
MEFLEQNWQYVLVFIGAMLVDITPVPLPPAFTIMIFLQIKFDLNIWLVIVVGVAGSIIGRYVLTLYVSKLSGKLLNKATNDNVKLLGNKMKHKGWKTQAFIFLYSLMPLPTTPLFVAGGIAKMKPYFIIPVFIVGKFISDSTAVLTGDYAAKNSSELLKGMVSWKSVTGLVLGLLLIFLLLFIDWHTVLLRKKFKLRFNVGKHGGDQKK